MRTHIESEVIYKFANAPILQFPFPHFYLSDVFPPEFYRDLLKNLPAPSQMHPIAEVRPVKGYKERFVMEMSEKHLAALPDAKKKFWAEFSQWLLAERFTDMMLNKFSPYIKARFKDAGDVSFYNEGLLIHDITNYSIGPHTDSPKKVISVLFYLPEDASQAELGTSIFIPSKEDFTCQGKSHYEFDHFNKVHTMPFVPNSVFVFLKTSNSFHGVEPITMPNCSRWVFLFDIYVKPAAAAAG